MADQSQDAENSEQIPGTGFEINIPGPSRHPHQVIDSSQNLYVDLKLTYFIFI